MCFHAWYGKHTMSNYAINDSAFRRVFKDTGRLLVAFLLGSVATVIGTLVAFKALPLLDMGADGWKARLAHKTPDLQVFCPSLGAHAHLCHHCISLCYQDIK